MIIARGAFNPIEQTQKIKRKIFLIFKQSFHLQNPFTLKYH